MDGKTVARMRLLERTAAELQTQNTYLSDQVLRMSEQVDQAAKASHVDRLLTAVLLRHFTIEGRVEVEIAEVDALRLAMGTAPGLSIHTAKDAERGVWTIHLKENEPEPACELCGGTGFVMRQHPRGGEHPNQCPNGCPPVVVEKPSLVVLP